MTKLTLYYPTFAEPDGEPESTEFNSLDDLKKDPTIKDRMFGLFGLRKTFAYENLLRNLVGKDSISMSFTKLAMAGTGEQL